MKACTLSRGRGPAGLARSSHHARCLTSPGLDATWARRQLGPSRRPGVSKARRQLSCGGAGP